MGGARWRAFARIAPAVLAAACARGDERRVDPTWLRQHVPDMETGPCEGAATGCRYKAIFGAGTPDAGIAKGVARYAGVILDAGGATAITTLPDEEQVYVILEGSGAIRYGDEAVPARQYDFAYLAPGVAHGLVNTSSGRMRAIVMGYRIPKGMKIEVPRKLPLANIEDVPAQTVAGHPPTTLYRLLMGDTTSTRDKIAAAHVLTSLFIMEFAPGGTNFPHHHDEEEEIYLVLEGRGDMVAGGGMEGVEGRHPARAGDAYFFRLNCTVGFYASTEAGSKARILAVRSRFPFGRREGR